MKDEPDESDNLAALADFKEEDLKEFENVNDFPNGEYIQYLNFSTLFSEKWLYTLQVHYSPQKDYF